MPKVWQIASGEAGRKYTDLFLRHDVMFCGPGRFGPWEPHRYKAAVDRGVISEAKMAWIRRFASDVRAGDVVLLRSGYRVVSIGAVDDAGYQFDPTFDDVYGSDLRHTQRVIWQEQFDEELRALQEARLLFWHRKQIPAFTAVADEEILKPIRHLFGQVRKRPLKALPIALPKALTLRQLSAALFKRGLSFEAVRQVRVAIQHQRRMIRWYRAPESTPTRPTEHEVVAHIVLPMLLALGWSEQSIAIEWQKIDLALFCGTPTDVNHCKLVCEAKGMGHGLQGVFEQARDYVVRGRLPNCDKLLVTDGQRFYLYRLKDGVWPDEPIGYLNIFKIRKEHLCPPGTNAIDTLMALTPSNVTT